MKRFSLKNIAAPEGFSFSGIHCGIKRSQRRDLGLIFSKLPCVASGMFTSNKVQAESLQVCREHLKHSESRALVVNSGNANCFTGSRGIKDSREITQAIARQLGVNQKSVLIASTGIIGKPLPMQKIKQGIPELCQGLSKTKVKDFAESILTTDTFKKCISLKIRIKNKPVLITGFAKGAGMIYPDLKHATMLVFILTDAAIKKSLLKKALASGVSDSFNCISVDGCMSTNDTVLILANGAAANRAIVKEDRDFEFFSMALSYVCSRLALMIIEDAEGKTKVIEVLVEGAGSIKEANLAADAVANSDLFKTAMYGGNPNWGRIVAAIGAAGIAIDQDKLEISFNKHKIYKKGRVYPIKSRDFLKKSKMINVVVDLHKGKFSHSVFTCDLTPEYVKINSEYN